jgi:hypothetical protein
VAAGNITTQPKQGRQALPMSSLCILLCLCTNINNASGNIKMVMPGIGLVLQIRYLAVFCQNLSRHLLQKNVGAFF